MKRAMRSIAMMAVAFVMAGGVHAGQTTRPTTTAGSGTDDQSKSTTATKTNPPNSDATKTDAKDANATVQPLAESSSAFPAAGSHMYYHPGNGYPKIEWSAGYSFWRAMPTATDNRMGYLHGGSTSLAFNFNKWVGFVSDFGGFDNDRLTLFGPASSQNYTATGGAAFTYLFGPRVSFRSSNNRITPYIQSLFGGVHAGSVTISGCGTSPICTPLGSENAFAMMFGTGLDIKLSHHIAWRLYEADFMFTRFHDPFIPGGTTRAWQDQTRFSTGLVFRFGEEAAVVVPPPPPPPPMVASCSADKDSVFAGSGDAVGVHAHVENAGNNPVNYAWSATAGTVDGTGADARWNSADRGLGVYVITAHANNGASGVAECSVNIRVVERPNRPPTMSCSADKSSVTVGQPVTITLSASDPDNDKLTFSWRTSGGRVEGNGTVVTFQTATLAPGSYAINGHVDDGRGGTADCTVNVEVQGPPEVKQLEARLALHSIYFATSRPTVQRPDEGLVQSQEDVLTSLAADFVHYLSLKPGAQLTLEGHADKRGTKEFNQQLTERRVARTKSFLVAHGVPEASIETKALGEEENMDEAQVKQLLDVNPELTAEERTKLEANLPIIVLANNRRVDITLHIAGQATQQSVRQFPFNAKDSLTLLSPSGAAGEKKAATPAKKKPAPPKQ